MVGGGFPRRSVTKSSPPRGGLFPGGGGHIPRSSSPWGGGFPRKFTPRGGGGGEDFRGGGFRGTPVLIKRVY